MPDAQIGTPGRPVRALSLSGAGFDAAMHLGVVHALMVIQGKAPDVVIGESAGAINAVALAEVLQAGDELENGQVWSALHAHEKRLLQRRRQAARAARFRQVLDAYQRAPTEVLSEMFPDVFQVDAQRPLQPVLLPIHDEREREARNRALGARAGLINLYNELLAVRLSFGTLARGLRRGLGLAATPEISNRFARWVARTVEVMRTWLLVGANLHRLAPLAATLVGAMRAPKPAGLGATAGAIIFRPRWLASLDRTATGLVWTVALVVVWIATSVAVILLPHMLATGIDDVTMLAMRFADSGVQKRTADILAVTHRVVDVAGYGLVAGLVIWTWASTAWDEVLAFNRTTTWRLMLDIGIEALGATALLAAWLAVAAGLGMLLVAGDVYLRLQGYGVEWMTLLKAWWIKGLVANALHVTVWFLVALGLLVWLVRPWRGYLRKLLAQYDIADGWLHPHALRQFFVRLFDPHYYGERPIEGVVEAALRDEARPPAGEDGGKLLAEYADATLHHSAIHVGLTVADVETGALRVVPGTAKVVDGLEAACAVTPFLPPKALAVPGEGTRLFIDGANVANEPTRALMDFLRGRIHPEASAVHVYAVAPLPFSRSTLGGPQKDYLSLMDVVPRALELQRFRDAVLERKLTRLFTRAIPPGPVKYPVNQSAYLRAYVVPIEPVEPIRLNTRWFQAHSKAHERAMMAEAVADGCRAALELMTRGAMPAGARPGDLVRCSEAVSRHLERQLGRQESGIVPDTLPGSEDGGGPGVPDVCGQCAIRNLRTPGARLPEGPAAKDTPDPRRFVLEVRSVQARGLAWPHERQPDDDAPAELNIESELEQEQEERDYAKRKKDALRVLGVTESAGQRWPKPRPGIDERFPDGGRPLVSLLFSGGVFRGVYQMGVLNALSELGLTPDIVAGASVGSITGAMVAQAFHQPTPAARRQRVGSLAATYTALDRLVLTDRFADFVRNLTLRTAACRFSLNQADRVFRQFDAPTSGSFSREVRIVTAGLERLFYLSPYELNNLVKAFRHRRTREVVSLLKRHAQEWLDRSGVGNQILGAEPLAELIVQHVIAPLGDDAHQHPDAVPFDAFVDRRGICLLATTTNLTRGRLEVLGEQQGLGTGRDAMLLDGLLASSAFPAVFRPRWSWEALPGTPSRHQYIDGGVMDNLPVEAVSDFLLNAKDAGLVVARPVTKPEPAMRVPHLLFSASLEVDAPPVGLAEMEALRANWPALLKRARTLSYNKKLQLFADAQRAVRDILTAAGTVGRPDLLDLEVVTVTPKWLCGTFAFHPMLGFRRKRQAQSIAHGCATTLLELARRAQRPEYQAWMPAWGLDPGDLPQRPPAADDPIRPVRRTDGNCWCRPRAVCPFSTEGLRDLDFAPATRRELTAIYQACMREDTHRGEP